MNTPPHHTHRTRHTAGLPTRVCTCFARRSRRRRCTPGLAPARRPDSCTHTRPHPGRTPRRTWARRRRCLGTRAWACRPAPARSRLVPARSRPVPAGSRTGPADCCSRSRHHLDQAAGRHTRSQTGVRVRSSRHSTRTQDIAPHQLNVHGNARRATTTYLRPATPIMAQRVCELARGRPLHRRRAEAAPASDGRIHHGRVLCSAGLWVVAAMREEAWAGLRVRVRVWMRGRADTHAGEHLEDLHRGAARTQKTHVSTDRQRP